MAFNLCLRFVVSYVVGMKLDRLQCRLSQASSIAYLSFICQRAFHLHSLIE